MQLRFALRCVPVDAFLPSATGTWQAWTGPPSRMGPRPFPTLPAEVGDGQILRLDRDVGGGPRNRRGIRLGLSAPAM